MMARTSQRAVLPWEYIVCTECLGKNPYAIWLVKFGCFEEQNHQQRSPKTTTVVVDTENMKLVSVRDPSTLPPRTTAHSQLEYDCWKALHIIKQQSESSISQQPTQLCVMVYIQSMWIFYTDYKIHSQSYQQRFASIVCLPTHRQSGCPGSLALSTVIELHSIWSQ